MISFGCLCISRINDTITEINSENQSILGSDTVSFGERFLTSWRHCHLQNIGTWSPTDTASHYCRLKTAQTPLWVPHISKWILCTHNTYRRVRKYKYICLSGFTNYCDLWSWWNIPKSNYQFSIMYDYLPTNLTNSKTTLPTYIPNYMEQDLSSEAHSFSTSQEILHILWNPTAHYHDNYNPSLVPILRQINLLHPHSISSISISKLSSLYAHIFQVYSLPQVSHQNSVCTSPLSHTYHMHIYLIPLISSPQ